MAYTDFQKAVREVLPDYILKKGGVVTHESHTGLEVTVLNSRETVVAKVILIPGVLADTRLLDAVARQLRLAFEEKNES